MDDLLASKQSSDEATGLAKDLIGVLATGGFRLTKWMSNSREVLTAIPSSELACDTIHLDRKELPQERAFNVNEFPNTKRGILSATSTVFGPLGLAAPYVINANLIIQELWRRQVKWDGELPNDILKKWQSWKEPLKTLRAITIPR